MGVHSSGGTGKSMVRRRWQANLILILKLLLVIIMSAIPVLTGIGHVVRQKYLAQFKFVATLSTQDYIIIAVHSFGAVYFMASANLPRAFRCSWLIFSSLADACVGGGVAGLDVYYISQSTSFYKTVAQNPGYYSQTYEKLYGTRLWLFIPSAALLILIIMLQLSLSVSYTHKLKSWLVPFDQVMIIKTRPKAKPLSDVDAYEAGRFKHLSSTGSVASTLTGVRPYAAVPTNDNDYRYGSQHDLGTYAYGHNLHGQGDGRPRSASYSYPNQSVSIQAIPHPQAQPLMHGPPYDPNRRGSYHYPYPETAIQVPHSPSGSRYNSIDLGVRPDARSSRLSVSSYDGSRPAYPRSSSSGPSASSSHRPARASFPTTSRPSSVMGREEPPTYTLVGR